MPGGPTPAPLPTQMALSIRSGAVSGSVPYTATVLPLRGEVPSGYTLSSADDATLRATVLSTHDDGSAAVVVVAGETSVSANAGKQLRLGTVAAGGEAALGAARIGALVSNVTVGFSGGYGTASLSAFGAPEVVWWTNARVICARYRLAAPTPGGTALEAVIDITAYGAPHNRALVEVVIENGRIDALSATGSTKPAAATYGAATVSVNGATVTTVSTASFAYTRTHQPFRAWYCKAWVGGDPQVRATQRHLDLQRHPLFWRMDKECTVNFATEQGEKSWTYGADAYTPWSTGRHRATNMGGGGLDESIGPLTRWDALALQSGDYRAWNASEHNALAMLTYNVNYRDSATGMVPDAARMPGKAQDGGATWPVTESYTASGTALFERAHQPAAGLMAFLSRPSPVFIEIAQKLAVWSATGTAASGVLSLFPASAVGVSDATGINYASQVRAFAWGVRQTLHATFLSPDGALNAAYAGKLTWRAGGKVWLGRSVRYAYSFKLDGYQENLRVMWEDGPNQKTIDWANSYDDGSAWAGVQAAMWTQNFAMCELHKVAATRLLAGTEKTYIDSFADWFLEQPVRWVNQQPNGAWRYVRDRFTVRRADGTTPETFAAVMANDIQGGGPSSVRGGWGELNSVNWPTWTRTEAGGTEASAKGSFVSQLWYALVAAVERDVPGAAAAWQTVTGFTSTGSRTTPGIANLDTWRQGFGREPRWGAFPRNRE